MCICIIGLRVRDMLTKELFGTVHTSGVDKTIEDATSGRVKREIYQEEKQWMEELRARWEEYLRIKDVDKLIQIEQLYPVQVSPVGVQTDEVVPTMPVVVKGAKRALCSNSGVSRGGSFSTC